MAFAYQYKIVKVAIVGKCEEMESGTCFIEKLEYIFLKSNKEKSNIAIILLTFLFLKLISQFGRTNFIYAEYT